MKKTYRLFCLMFLSCFYAVLTTQAQTLKADYQFQGNLNSSVAGAPAMTNLGCGGSNSFASDVIDGYTRQTVRFPFNCGLQVSTSGGLIPSNTYTIVLLFRFDDVSGFRRGIDFSNGASDQGAYIFNGRFENEVGTGPPFLQNTYSQVTIVREPTGIIRAYRDGAQRLPVNQSDAGTFIISGANTVRFFQDDINFPTEASAGNLARIRLYDSAMTDAQVRALDRMPSGTATLNSVIAFGSQRNNNNEIYVMEQDGSNQIRLTNNSFNELTASWSPNGQRLAFESDRDGNYEIYTMSRDGTSPVRLTNNTFVDTYPDWSPDGSKILFSRCQTTSFNDCDVWSMNEDGSGQFNLTNNGAAIDDNFATWSPDGNRIVFQSTRDGNGELYVMNQDGSNVIRLTNSPGLDYQPAWSPDGTKIAFSSARDGDHEIFLMNADGTNLVNLTNNSTNDFKPSFSPDGASLTFAAVGRNGNLAGIGEIYRINSNGTNEFRLTANTAHELRPDWSPQSTLESCISSPANFGQGSLGFLSSNSCIIGSNQTDNFSFSGTATQQVAITIETSQFFSKIELLNPSGTVIATAGGVNGVNNSRLPATGFFTLPVTGTYTIRAIAAFGGSGQYTISLFEAPAQTCTYSLSPTQTNVPPAGGTSFFDVLTQPGCPPASLPASSGSIYSGLSYSGGRVTFEVSGNSGGARQDVITLAGQTHTINQFGISPPANDGFGSAQVLTGLDSPAGNPVTGYNTTATSDAGEPPVGGNVPAKSVWYSWTAPESGLYSFSTSGSSFDTVMAIFACPSSGECTFASLIPVGSNDDTTFFDKTSKVNFRATEGTEYRIAVDGKNGASGTIELSWRQYQRLFRLYLQNYNGDQITIVPDTITASNGSNTVIPTLVSMGVYEFDLPADNTTYLVTLSGPEGIVWDPNNFPLDTSTLVLDELMKGPTSAGQNSVSNAQNQTPRFIYGFIKQITQPEVNGLSVLIGSSRGPNPRDPAPCSPLAFTTISSVPYATYQCLSQPQTLHDIVPRRTGKKFTISVLSFDNPINTTYNGTPGNSFLATNVPTHNITGQVLAGGSGTVVDLAFTPEGLNAEIALRTVTDSSGAYSFPDLPSNTYKLKASREGVVFTQPEPVQLQSDQMINISPEMVCTYTPADLTQAPGTGGPGQFTINTNDPTCAWQAKSEAPWIVINSGVGVGKGPVHFTVLANDGSARTGGITISGRPEPISLEQAASSVPAFATVSGQILTAGGLGLRNAVVSITDATGTRRSVQVSPLGFYSIENVATGINHVISVSSKRFRFASRTVNLTGNLSNVDFVGLE